MASPHASPSKKRKINITGKSKPYFNLVSEENGKIMYQCILCNKPVNGTKSSNLSGHLKTHPDKYAELCSDKSIIEYKRLKLLLDCVELVTVNGRAFKCLNDSAIHCMNEEVLSELRNSGRALNLVDPHLIEVKNELNSIAHEIRERIGQEVNRRAVSLLVDIVTKRGRSIFGVSVQYILNKIVKVRSIAMINLEESHTGKYLAELLHQRLTKLGIDVRQAITITTDSGSNVLKMVRDVEAHLQSADHVQPTTPSKSAPNILY